jgi:hypothetical protein
LSSPMIDAQRYASTTIRGIGDPKRLIFSCIALASRVSQSRRFVRSEQGSVLSSLPCTVLLKLILYSKKKGARRKNAPSCFRRINAGSLARRRVC